MAALRFSPRARADLQNILTYISADSPERTRAFVDRIRERCEMLCAMPKMGRIRSEFGALRSLSVKPVVVFYRFDGTPLTSFASLTADGISGRYLLTTFSEWMARRK